MTERVFPDTWKIIGSTSLLFPVGSGIRLPRAGSRFEFLILRKGQPEDKLFEGELPDITAPEEDPALVGDVPDGNGQKVRLVATLCPGEPDGPSFLCGQVVRGRIGDGATGVWVAEEERPTRSPGGER